MRFTIHELKGRRSKFRLGEVLRSDQYALMVSKVLKIGAKNRVAHETTLKNVDFKRLPRPVWPIDQNAVFAEPVWAKGL